MKKNLLTFITIIGLLLLVCSCNNDAKYTSSIFNTKDSTSVLNSNVINSTSSIIDIDFKDNINEKIKTISDAENALYTATNLELSNKHWFECTEIEILDKEIYYMFAWVDSSEEKLTYSHSFAVNAITLQAYDNTLLEYSNWKLISK